MCGPFLQGRLGPQVGRVLHNHQAMPC